MQTQSKTSSYFCLGLFCLAAIFLGAANSVVAQPPEGVKLKSMPWHLVDLWWHLDADMAFESLEMDVEIQQEVPANVRLYIAPIGIAHLSGVPFYGGMQTQSDGYTKSNRRLQGIGRGLLMSMWGEREYEAIRPSLGGFCQSSGHEGDFVSVRRPYEWRAGKYTYRIAKMDRDGDNTWVGAFLYSHENDENIFIGALRFPASDLKLAPRVANFVEIYGPEIPIEKIPRIDVLFGPIRVNGGQATPSRVSAQYDQGVPDVVKSSWQRERSQALVQVGVDWIERPNRTPVLFERPDSSKPGES